MSLRVLVTGDRNWTDGDFVQHTLEQIPTNFGVPPEDVTLICGRARGLDTIAEYRATLLGWKIEPYPANWNEYGRAAGPIRNQQMLNSGVDVCLAFHNSIDESKGTKDMIRRVERAGIRGALYGNGSLIRTWNWSLG